LRSTAVGSYHLQPFQHTSEPVEMDNQPNGKQNQFFFSPNKHEKKNNNNNNQLKTVHPNTSGP